MRVVFDTNVVVSGLLWGGSPRSALNTIQQEGVTGITSIAMLAELRKVLSRPKFETQIIRVGQSVEALIQDYTSFMHTVETPHLVGAVPQDTNDDKVIACALGGGADYIVSGDQHLLALGAYEGIKIVSAEDFLALLP